MTPNNFSWVDEHVAGSSYPRNEDQFKGIAQEQIKAIINLTKRPEYDASQEILDKFQHYSIKIKDFHPPTIEQLKQIMDIIDEYKQRGEKVMVHCIAGCGRTGTILAAYLLHSGLVTSGAEALEKIREMRPCSVETEDQEKIIEEFSKILNT